MRKFKGNRKLDDVIQTAQLKGFEVDMDNFNKGDDWLWLRDMNDRMLQIVYNTTNGHFYVYDPLSGDKPSASHKSVELDNESWYIELLEMFYESLEEVV